ncbi:MAG TPA: DNA alkylation repair protein [Candidatus Methanoperedens sp.]
MEIDEIITRLKSLSNPKSMEGMARYGINPEKTLGVSISSLRQLAKEIGKSHALAQQLWDTGIHEARILAGMIDEPDKVNDSQMERWVRDFDSWDVCDQCCMNLFDRTEFAYSKAIEWSSREEEFVKRAGFALMAVLASHDKKAGDEAFLKFFPAIEKESVDERTYVKKAVNWALRQIGKRNINLNRMAIETAKNIRKIDSRVARCIAADTLKELAGEAVQNRLADKKTKS